MAHISLSVSFRLDLIQSINIHIQNIKKNNINGAMNNKLNGKNIDLNMVLDNK